MEMRHTDIQANEKDIDKWISEGTQIDNNQQIDKKK